MITPIANAESMQIGSVDFVSPDEIKVVLDLEAPNDVALNSGVPRPFPRINSYVLVSCEGGFLVAQIEWITVEPSQYPKRRGMQDFGIIDLPYPLRKMSLTPLGILREKIDVTTKQSNYVFARGIDMFPTVGDPVLLPSQDQLKSIVESGSNRRVNIGISPLAGNATVSVDPDRLFGRHLAVLGNTGSGKSCSVAGLVRWSIEAAQRKKSQQQGSTTHANTRFIILDPNGEYTTAFSDLPNVHVYGVEKDDDRGIEQLVVPAWLWNTSEWAAFTQASSKAQKPTLTQALRSVRDGQIDYTEPCSHSMRQFLRTLVTTVGLEIRAGSPWGRFPQPKAFFEKISKWRGELDDDVTFNQPQKDALQQLRNFIDALITARSAQYANMDFTKTEVKDLFSLLRVAHQAFGGNDQDVLPIDADVPRPFSGEDFLRSIEANAELMNTSDYVETMLMRVKTLLSDAKLKPVISPETQVTLNEWLDKYICPSNSTEGSITIMDLSLVPAELTHIIVSVMARMTLESLQRYRKMSGGQTIPTVLIMEEAHTFIKRYNADSENGNTSEMCAKIFEKIAREGRKFGLGLILSSQRPSELSSTVLSQCNSFLLHRISNDRDQELVSKLVPDTLRGLLRELPSLPSRNAILLGWASELPVMVKMNFLKEEYRPQSNDPDYWNVWTTEQRTVQWKAVADDWQGIGTPPQANLKNENET
mgnify:CR=1 FL=1